MMKNNYKEMIDNKKVVKDEKGKIIAELNKNVMLIPWVLSINVYAVLTSRKNMEKLRDFLKNNFSLYVEDADVVEACKKGTFSAWLFENPNNYQDLQVVEM